MFQEWGSRWSFSLASHVRFHSNKLPSCSITTVNHELDGCHEAYHQDDLECRKKRLASFEEILLKRLQHLRSKEVKSEILQHKRTSPVPTRVAPSPPILRYKASSSASIGAENDLMVIKVAPNREPTSYPFCGHLIGYDRVKASLKENDRVKASLKEKVQEADAQTKAAEKEATKKIKNAMKEAKRATKEIARLKIELLIATENITSF
ncbi:hypothetical protein COCNU_12G003520 [Cocos nucifera]|uniref:Uncharacterized protein n=1 Tax=Cocos nucifera TaxID=13894 RepID=A0A8K0ISV2_COCNU|nr:hypothetical protein COCNU_12G003520 [Cocos nucifera]